MSDPRIHQSNSMLPNGISSQTRNSSRYLSDMVTGDTPLRSSTGHLNISSHSHSLHEKNHNNNNIFKHSDSNNKSSLNNIVNGCRMFNNNINMNSNHHKNQQLDMIEPKARIMICLTDFIAAQDNDLSVRKGDRLMVSDCNNPDWFIAEHLATKRTGFVPKNYVAYEAIEMEEWFFSRTNRRDAEKLLSSGNLPRGTFLVRRCEHENTGYSLSIRDEDKTQKVCTKHYKISILDNGYYYITTRSSFQTMNDLIAYYSQHNKGLCYRLVRPCPKPKPRFWPDRGDELDRSELKQSRKIGTGFFGEVFYGTYRDHTEVAIKTLKQGTMSPQAFLEEAVIMRKCRHDNLVPLYGVCSQEEPLLIVTEYMCNGSLLEYLRNNPEGKRLKLPDLMDMACQIASGMAYLEQVKLIHRDLAARNILVGEKGKVKVADFGLARVIEDSEYTARQGAKFPIKWTAPEAAMYGKFSIKSDVWSYGILHYELITYGSIPYAGMHNKEVIEHIQRGYRLPKPTQFDCPDELYKKMCDCWQSDPEKRPTFDFLRDFFENYSVSAEQSYRDAVDCF